MEEWDVGGREGEKKWRWDRIGSPEGRLGEGRDSHAQRGPPMIRGSTGTGRDPREGRGLEGIAASVSPAHWAPGSLLRSGA